MILMLYVQRILKKFPPFPLNQEDDFMFLIILYGFMEYIQRARMPLPYLDMTIRTKILEKEVSGALEVRDFFGSLINRPFEFWILTGETTNSFRDLLIRISPRTRRFRYGQKYMSLENRLLMTLIWLRQYPTHTQLSLNFGVSVSSVSSNLKRMWLILWEEIGQPQLWPSVQSWQHKIGEWSEMPNVLGCIDGTSHEILTPSNEPQEEFYSGHRKYHCIHTQV